MKSTRTNISSLLNQPTYFPVESYVRFAYIVFQTFFFFFETVLLSQFLCRSFYSSFDTYNFRREETKIQFLIPEGVPFPLKQSHHANKQTKNKNTCLIATDIEKQSSYSNKRKFSKKFVISRKQKQGKTLQSNESGQANKNFHNHLCQLTCLRPKQLNKMRVVYIQSHQHLQSAKVFYQDHQLLQQLSRSLVTAGRFIWNSA